ncbi:MAG: hypothetical protein P3W97_005020 [Tepidimonas sp.]|uniref:hypothetical protein n=1 Tax=Tepidimonas sp. TaxID=2002775 RepID=UPI00259F27EC|nr:hypothetical protein [Tepidimonas sp.]MDM7456614.1 hypothetical protein [Tepidimonas sp.]
MRVSEAQRLRELDGEDAKRKKRLAEAHRDTLWGDRQTATATRCGPASSTLPWVTSFGKQPSFVADWAAGAASA